MILLVAILLFAALADHFWLAVAAGAIALAITVIRAPRR